MRKVIRGVGMTAETFHVPDTLEEKAKAEAGFREAWRVAENSFEIEIAWIEEWARRQLVTLGYADLKAYYAKDNPVGNSMGDRVGSAAANVLGLIATVRVAITKGDAQEAARFAVKIGHEFATIQLAMDWEKYSTGLKSGDYKKGGETMKIRAQEHTDHIRTAVLDMLNNRKTCDWTDGDIATWLMEPERSFQTYKGKTRSKKTMVGYVATIREEFKSEAA